MCGRRPARKRREVSTRRPTRSSLEVDHVIAGTGFRIDLARLAYLPGAPGAYRHVQRLPGLSRAGESTVPGLYLAGAPAAFGLGPSMRFIAGTHIVSPQLARSAARRAEESRGRPVASRSSSQVLQSSDEGAFQETA